MLAPYRPQLIEKILTDAAGRQFRVVFAVSYMNGEVRGHIVSATEVKAMEAKALCLPGARIATPASGTAYTVRHVVSPYFSLEFLINSQPTQGSCFCINPVLIKVRVTTDARAEKVVKYSDDSYLVSVREKAERNMANRRILRIMREMFPGKSVKLVKGHQSPAKIVEVR